MKKLHILLIDDDKIEAMKLQRALSKLNLSHSFSSLENGELAFEYLENNKLPDIILLDLNMPKINGLEFLSSLRKHATFKYLPTIINSTSCNNEELLACYELGVSGYIVKPLKFEDYLTQIANIMAYWSMNELVKL